MPETFPEENRLPLTVAAVELAGVTHLVGWNFRQLVNVELMVSTDGLLASVRPAKLTL